MANASAEAAGELVVGRESKEKHPPAPSKRGFGEEEGLHSNTLDVIGGE